MIRTQLGILIVSVVAALSATSVAFGQAPKPINRLATMSSQPGAAERADIDAYVRYYAERLVSEDLAECEEARDRLSSPLRSPGLTLIFRSAYSGPLIDALGSVILQDDRPMAAFNAIQIISLLATQNALEEMRQHCKISDEPRPEIRLRAAIGIQNILIHAGTNVIPPRDETRAIRDLGDAAEAETVDWVLYRQFHALASVENAVATQVLDAAFDSVVARLRGGQASELVVALRPAIVNMRDRQLADPSSGTATAPRLTNLLELPLEHWAGAVASDSLRASYLEFIKNAEAVLQIIDQPRGRRLQSELSKSFLAGDRDGYDRSLGHVREVISSYR